MLLELLAQGAPVESEHLRGLGFRVTGDFEPTNTDRPTNIDEMSVAYTKTGKEKLEFIADEIRSNFGFAVKLNNTASPDTLTGDIQISFQKYF